MVFNNSILAGSSAAGGEFYDYQIENSLRLNRGDSANLERTPSSEGNRQTHTISMWVKRVELGRTTRLFGATNNSASATFHFLEFNSTDTIRYYAGTEGSSAVLNIQTNAVFRDVSAWYHIVAALDTTQATSSNRAKLYVNGTQITSLANSTYGSQDANYRINDDIAHYINKDGSSLGNQFSSYYVADVTFIDGQQLDPTSFGETKSGVWIPKNTSGLTFGDNGFRLEFSDSAAIGDDTSGNGNDFTANSLSAHDVVPDSPTVNYAIANVLAKGGNLTLTEGNLRVEANSSTTTSAVPSTIGITTGKWYAEYHSVNPNTSNSRTRVGISSVNYLVGSTSETQGLIDNGVTAILDGQSTYRIYENGTLIENSGTVASGDIIGIAFDADAQTVEFYLNGVKQGTSTPYDVASVGDGIYYFLAGQRTSADGIFNFGQDSTFAGATTAGGNSDENGYGDFKYAVPSGYLALNSANLPEPDITPLDDDVPEDYFNTAIWTGNGTSQTISGVSHQPDFMWIKRRSTSRDHQLVDTVRGLTVGLQSNLTNAESTDAQKITSVNSDGYVVGSSLGTNANNETYVGWSWLAGGTAVSNTDGSITSSVSANTEAGFSIITYTGTGGASDTVGHGLSIAPEMIIVKDRDSGSNFWAVYHVGVDTTAPEDYLMRLNTTDARLDGSVYWNDTAPTASVFTIGTSSAVNNTNDYVAYCFHSVEGYSKFGSYTGNGSSDGTFVYIGFRPAFVMIKNTGATAGWHMYDSARGTTVGNEPTLNADSNSAETTSGDRIDFASSGFKLKINQTNVNANGNNYIYMAFAEMPFKYANAI